MVNFYLKIQKTQALKKTKTLKNYQYRFLIHQFTNEQKTEKIFPNNKGISLLLFRLKPYICLE